MSQSEIRNPKSEILDTEFLRKLEHLALVSKKVFTGQLQGERRSTKRGTSVEFADYRNYVHGDDLRYIDWNTYARLEKMFLKLFIEEEDMHVYVLVDGSQSMAFGSPSKYDYARRAAAALGYIGLANYDRVGASVFSDRVREHLAPVRGRSQVFRYFDFLEKAQVGGGTSLSQSLKDFSQRTRRSGIAILLSDFFDPGWETGLKALLGRRFQTTVVHVLDRAELQPDVMGDVKLVDSETGQEREISVNPTLLREYQAAVERFCGGVMGTCRRYGADYLRVTTDTPFDDLILKWLRQSGLVK